MKSADDDMVAASHAGEMLIAGSGILSTTGAAAASVEKSLGSNYRAGRVRHQGQFAAPWKGGAESAKVLSSDGVQHNTPTQKLPLPGRLSTTD